jgi:uncharacterized membrane protein (DUF106 family)
MADKGTSPFLMMLVFLLVILVLFDPGIRNLLTVIAGGILDPIIGLDSKYPVLTIFLAATIVIIITTLIRHFSTDWMEMAKTQRIMSKWQKEYREARLKNNTYKIKKLQKIQPELMKRQTKMSGKQMKLMPITMLIFIPIFAWIWTFLSGIPYHYFVVPWASHVDFFNRHAIMFYNWILLYMILSIPLTQVLQYLLKIISWRKKLIQVKEG